MRIYLSSYKLGNRFDILMDMIPPAMRVGLVMNAKDHLDEEARALKTEAARYMLTRNTGARVKEVDLREYSYKTRNLESTLSKLDALWVHGGDVFVLREAMENSGADKTLIRLIRGNELVYAGESAGGCVMGADLRLFGGPESPEATEYLRDKQLKMRGLGLIGRAFIPHFRGQAQENTLGERDYEVQRAVRYCEEMQVGYTGVRDGEALVISGEVSRIVG